MEDSYKDVLQGISSSCCHDMMECFGARERHYNAGDVICEYNQHSTLVGILKSGSASLIRIDVYGVRTILETLESGEMFGEAWPFPGLSEDSITVVCDKATSILFFEYSHILHPCGNSCAHHTALQENVFRLMSRKSMALSERIEVLSRRTIRDKLLCYFSLQSMRSGSSTFNLPFSISALADYHLFRPQRHDAEMKNMRQNGLIDADGRKITLLLD